MATNSKVFVSPGVYTSEVDLSFVAQSVGVTTLGIVGETLIGPAFEPIFITSFDEYQTVFGGTSPEKYINTQIPKYEASYIAKAYLQQSNQLFVTRILGLSGYDAGPSWSVATVANVDLNTVGIYCIVGFKVLTLVTLFVWTQKRLNSLLISQDVQMILQLSHIIMIFLMRYRQYFITNMNNTTEVHQH